MSTHFRQQADSPPSPRTRAADETLSRCGLSVQILRDFLLGDPSTVPVIGHLSNRQFLTIVSIMGNSWFPLTNFFKRLGLPAPCSGNWTRAISRLRERVRHTKDSSVIGKEGKPEDTTRGCKRGGRGQEDCNAAGQPVVLSDTWLRSCLCQTIMAGKAPEQGRPCYSAREQLTAASCGQSGVNFVCELCTADSW